MAVFCASLFFEKENATVAEGEHPIGLASGGLRESRSRHGGGKRGEELSWQRIGEKRSQFRIHVKNLRSLYKTMDAVDVRE